MLRTFTTPLPVDLGLTLAPLHHGGVDPTMKIGGGVVSRATRTPEGPASQHLRVNGGRVEVEAWGPGATWLLDNAPHSSAQTTTSVGSIRRTCGSGTSTGACPG